MKKIFILFIPVFILMVSCAGEQVPDAREQQIFSFIIDSVFNDSYQTVAILDSSMSVMRFATKTTFSEDLFGREPLPYLLSLFREKGCRPDKALLEAFIERNKGKYPLAERYKPGRNYIFTSYRSVYDFMYGSVNRDSDLYQTVQSKKRFGIISLSRAAFNSDQSLALVEVNIFRKRRGENFFITLKKNKDAWRVKSVCYVHGPYKVREQARSVSSGSQ